MTISRCSNCYGSYKFPEKLIPLIIVNALNDKPLPVFGNGLHVRDWWEIIVSGEYRAYGARMYGGKL